MARCPSPGIAVLRAPVVLDRLLGEGIAARDERRIKNAPRPSGLPFLKALDSFDFAFQPSLDPAQVMDPTSPHSTP